jgi:hypothetical protein
VTHVAFDPTKPATMVDSAQQVQWYNLFATNDAIVKLGGNPYNNLRPYHWYFGSRNDLLLNQKIQRYAADPAVFPVIQNTLQTSGSLDKPLVTMHTLLDPVVPYWHEILYSQKVFSKGSWAQRINVPIPSYGHCAFTPPQVLAAFGIMVLKATSQGLTPMGVQAALPDPQAQQEYQALQDQIINSPNPPPTSIFLPMVQQ